ncbi:MAG: 3-hydroxyacyl-CoA dehydrogenase NAD-binding domain-containing protein [Sphingomonadaceae bacterium]|nr:3-hydroxyacyl-CoA dehydrogenase NAD-binding domain-containing protein [Sphingomonadaceae bacterium]
MTEAIHITVDADGVAMLTIDVRGQSMNVATPAFYTEFHAALDRIVSDETIKGAVIHSGKASGFMGGADLKSMATMLGERDEGKSRSASIYSRAKTLSALYRRVETIGKPVAIAVDGVAMGGGFELVMSCHYRVASDSPKTKFGLPEVMVGLLPGAGGCQRLPRLMGIQAALPYLLQGKTMSAAEAKQFGVIHEVAPAADIIDTARHWVLANPGVKQNPWDVKGFKLPGGAGMFNPGFVQTFMGANAMVQKESWRNYNAVKAILQAVYEGSQLPIDKALDVEVKYFTTLFTAPQAANMIRTLFINKQAADKGARRPASLPPMPTQKLAMVGAGLMGSGIAMVSAQAGIDVVLLDRDEESAAKGKAYTEERLAKRRTAPEKMAQVLGRITPTTDYAALAGSDLIIEAVFEDPALKREVTAKIEAVVGPDTMYGSNTSTLPITGLQANWSKPENFIGIHFFSPVEKMQLVEIIVGKNTGDAAIAKALDYVRQIGKTPIVVNDRRGFYTSRCFATYVQEGMTLLAEGVTPALIENSGRLAGMPVGPLAVGDEVAIDLMGRIGASMAAEVPGYQPTVADGVVAKMLENDRKGRKNSKGFYTYPAEKGSKKRLWEGLADLFPRSAAQPTTEEVQERLIKRQVVECVRCMEEGVLVTPADGDLGAIFGWGFAPFTGGPFSLVDTMGAAHFVDHLHRLADKHGERFAPPQLLIDMARTGRTFYADSVARAAA